MERSSFLTSEVADRAIRLCISFINDILNGPAERQDLFIVVRDPRFGDEEAGILAAREWGDTSKWQYEFNKYAHGKVQLAIRHQRDVSTIFALPDPTVALVEGDPLYIGGVYMSDAQLCEILGKDFAVGVGVSGVQAPLDETIGRVISATVIGLIKLKLADQLRQPSPTDANWYGDKARAAE